MLWALAGTMALIYGIVGIAAQALETGRHPLAVVWFIIAAGGGASMISFVWHATRDDV